MRTLVLFFIGLLLVTSSPSRADDDAVLFARSLLARDFDANLPAQPIEKWLLASLPKGIKAHWEEYATDCGEQTGDPAIDKTRDLPLCVEIELRRVGKPAGSLMLFVGTQKGGTTKEHVGLYFGNIMQGNKTVWLKKLGDLTSMQ
jgi:hypothetical protein